MSENPPIALMLLPLPLVVGSVIGVVIGFATGSWLWAIVALVVTAITIGAVAFLAAESLALRLLNARPLAAGGSLALRNHLEELCARTGLAEPDLYTVGSGAPAIASVGRVGSALVVTDGLTDDLTVVELEAAVARELGRIQSGSTTVDTLAVAFLTVPFGFLGGLVAKALRFFRGGDHDAPHRPRWHRYYPVPARYDGSVGQDDGRAYGRIKSGQPFVGSRLWSVRCYAW